MTMLTNTKRTPFPIIFVSFLIVVFLLISIPEKYTDAAFLVSPAAALDTTQVYFLPDTSDIQITVNEIIASGFDKPVQVTHAGDGSNRLFVVEQSGKIRIIAGSSILPNPFIDLTTSVVCCGERGLLGLAFHPDYTSNGFYYVNYTRAGDGATVIDRYQVSAGDPNLAAQATKTTLLTIPQPYTNHNGGQLLFNPVDGYLYIGMGDGGSGGDPLNSGQDINSVLGKLLRLDVDGGSPYKIPPDNPFVGVNGLDEIWAYGLRNPWRFSFDRLTGDLYIGDVGQGLWEEIDYQAAGTQGGINFGWNCREGTHDYNFTGSCLTAALTNPIAEYSHTEGKSVTGGFVYRGNAYPALTGRYFYADYVDGKIWSLYKTESNPDTWSTPELELDTSLNISSFGEDEIGEIYITTYDGSVRRLADLNGPTPDLTLSTKSASTPSADPDEIVTYTINLINTSPVSNNPVSITDTIPSGLTYVPNSMWASHGSWDDSAVPVLEWQGNLNASQNITINYQVTVTGVVTGSLVNHADVSYPPQQPIVLYASLTVPRSALQTTTVDFVSPGTQPGDLHTALPSSVDCDTCHSAPIYDRWRGSMMSQAGRDPLLWTALAVANADAPGSGEYCLRCHTPLGWLEGRSTPSNGSSLLGSDISNGVACALCHRSVDPVPSTMDEAAAIDLAIRAGLTNPVPLSFTGSAAMIVDPDDNRRGPFSFGLALPYHSAYQTDFLRQTGDAITRSRMCGTCHNVFNPVLSWDQAKGQFWPNDMDSPPPSYGQDQLFPIETTFDEWLNSAFAQGGVYSPSFAGAKPDGIVRTCQDCHMVRATGKAADDAFNPQNRDCLTSGCLPVHIFAGGNTWVPKLLQDTNWRLNASSEKVYLDETVLQAQNMLEKAASLTVDLQENAGIKTASVRVTNHTGHKLPTGYPEGRRMWFHLQAFDSQGSLVYETGSYNPLTGELTYDPDLKVYEVNQGITPELAALLPQSDGESFHFVLNNTVIKDNRIPPQGYTQALYNRPGLRPVGTTYVDGQYWDDTVINLPPQTSRVFVTLYYQTSSKEYIDFLRLNGGVDGISLGQLWESSKSPPVIMAQAWDPNLLFLPVVFR